MTQNTGNDSNANLMEPQDALEDPAAREDTPMTTFSCAPVAGCAAGLAAARFSLLEMTEAAAVAVAGAALETALTVAEDLRGGNIRACSNVYIRASDQYPR